MWPFLSPESLRRRRRVSNFAILGMFTSAWARAEYALDGCILVIFHFYGGKDLETELPRALENKTKFLKRAYKTLPSLAPFAEEGVEIAGRFTALKIDRHDLIHGIVSLGLGDSDKFQLFRMIPGAQVPTKRERAFSYRELANAAEKTMALGYDVAEHVERLLDRTKMTADEPDQTG